MRADVPAGADPAACAMIDAVVARLPSAKDPRGEAAATPKLSAILLVAANLAPLYGVLFLGWEVFPLLVLFWAENVVVGVLNAGRRPSSSTARYRRLSKAPSGIRWNGFC